MMRWKHWGLALLLVLAVTGCAGKDRPRALTDAEIQQANEAFVSTRPVEGKINTITSTEISCFFTSYYDTPEEINFDEFLYVFPSDEVLQAGDETEFEAVINLPGSGWDAGYTLENFPVPVHRYQKKDVSEVLEWFAGVTVDDLMNTENVLYLEEFDSFYNFTSDFGPGYFQCEGGEIVGDTVRMWAAVGEGGYRELTLRKDGDSYKIQSFRYLDEEMPGESRYE